MSNAKLFFDTYVSQLGQVTVVDVGAQDVNGSLREVCPQNARYVGVDFVNGKGVDVVLTDPYSLPFDSNSVDVVVSSSCFEHSEMFWVLFLEILRILKPSGLFYLNAPSNGNFHRYPVDCWRFYPDSGNALVTWARKSGINAALLEAYISFQSRDIWNDFVGVFAKDAGSASLHQNRILHKFKDYYNGMVAGREGFLNFKDAPEDLLKIRAISGIVNGHIPVR
jgi:SAM-dependent methyltransferase